MLADEIVTQCLRETGARGISKHSPELAYLGLIYAQAAVLDRRSYRAKIRGAFLRSHPEVGSVFLVFILPLLISLISNWIIKWILNRKDLTRIQGQAYDALIALSPRMTDTLTSTSTPPKKRTEPSE